MLSTACDSYITDIYAFNHAHIVWAVALAGGKRNMKVASHGTQSFPIERA
jgi:hypothetical protein